jgi:parallel beta-helix repeat protein
MKGKTLRGTAAKGLMAGALIVGFVAVVSHAASATTPPIYFVRNNASPSGNCKSWALTGTNQACTLATALSLATLPTDRIVMRRGTYNVAGNDVINTSDLGTDTGLKITGGYKGVGNPGGFSGYTTLEPPTLAGNGIIDFSKNNGITIRRLSVDSANVTPPYNTLSNLPTQAPVLNTGLSGNGVNDILGATPKHFEVVITGIAAGSPATPVNAVDLTGGTTTLDNVRVSPVPGYATLSAYTANGISCTGSTTICTVTGSKVVGTTNPPTAGIVVSGGASATVTDNLISSNATGGVLLQGTLAAQTISGNKFVSNAGGGVIATGTLNQSTGTTVSHNTISGPSAVGVELEQTGGFTISGNTVSGLGSGGEGFVLAGSDNNTVTGNTVTSSAAGAYVGGNDITGPSDNNTISTNNLSNNLLGGAVADGFGSPTTWNHPGTFNQGIQGGVFFQSSVAVPAVAIGTGACAGLPCGAETVVTPTFGPGDYAGVAAYLAAASIICPAGIPVSPGLYACTDGNGDIMLYGTPTSAISAGNGEATGPSTTGEPGCESGPPAYTDQPSCTGDVLTLSTLPFINTVASSNVFNGNLWNNETVVGAIDGSGPNAEFTYLNVVYMDGASPPPANIQNTWTNNVGSPNSTPCNPTTTSPACGT